MQTLRSIEFFNDPEGGVMVRDTEGVHTYQPEDKMLTGALFTRIETEYPKAFKALAEIYRKSRANVNYYRFLICHRFIRCNFGRLDNRQDIDGMGRFTFEDVSCPIKGECKYAGIICSPEFNTRLTERQKEVMKLYMEGMGDEEIADITYRPRRCAQRSATPSVRLGYIRWLSSQSNTRISYENSVAMVAGIPSEEGECQNEKRIRSDYRIISLPC